MFKVTIFVFCLFVSQVYSILPASIVATNCKRFDPNINSCLVRRAGEFLRAYHGGIPQIGIPSIDPLFLNENKFRENDTVVKLEANVKDIILLGHKDATFSQFTFNPQSLSGVVDLTIPHLTMRSKTRAHGTVGGFPVNTEAIHNWAFDGVQYKFQYQLETVQNKGLEYFNVTKLALQSYSEHGALEIESTNPANAFLDNAVQNMFNSNPRVAMDLLNSFMTKSAAEMYTTVVNYILYLIPANELLPK